MGVDGRDGRRDGEAGVGERKAPRSGQVPGQGGPLGATSPSGRHEGAEARTGAGPSVPPQREARGAGPATGPGDRDLPPSDAQLLSDLRAGDDSAYEAMYRRHAAAVRRYARSCCRDAHTAEDLTGEVFARTLQAVRGGAGPESAVRAYLLTTVRRVAASWAQTSRREQLVEDFAVFAVSSAGAPEDDATLDPGADVRAMQEAERSMAVRAFRSLPERYQTVLWHTTVEDESPSEVAPLLGLTANATAVLAHRAREGLKQAYLQAHVSQSLTDGGDCARYADRLGAYARGGLRMRAERGLRKHLDACPRCRLAALEVADVNQRIGALLPVAFLGWCAAGYAVKTAVAGAAGVAAGAAATATAGSGGSGATGSAGAAVGKGLSGAVKAGIGVGAAVVAGATLSLALTASPKPAPTPEPRAQAPRPAVSAPQQPAPRSSRPGLPPAGGAAPAPKGPAQKPAPDHTRGPRSTPTAKAAPPEPTRAPTPPSTPPHRSTPPEPTRPEPTPPKATPPKPTPRPPQPAPAAYRVNALAFDFMGDGSKPEVRTLASSWLWQRRSPQIAGTTYAHGVSVHGRSSVTIDLNRRCTAYDAVAGVDDLSAGPAAVRFSVYADGVRLWQSGTVHGGERAVPVHVPLTGRKTLRLVTDPANPVGAVALADWAQSTIMCR
ncbi:sigma-70 family RNA polymerase sigma factor [Streptomyces lydicamycinicus]|uniref:sigma-70 family RNA polymerase sigma factor n=1 Tax=Streptomyces lydicamycinicus TaxID=1546107 RepID=UPI002035548E|nr:sigma-70 family RNA polymerase sigma factor [Streptomyces lydicamycinicus]USA02497.1 sigma-70 family RNA polymerase sigma factor [Streptomyces lydicamycinicus]